MMNSSQNIIRSNKEDIYPKYDLILFNSKQKIQNVTHLDEDLFIFTDFSGILESSFKEIKKNNNHRKIIGNDFTINFFRDHRPSSNFILKIYGKAGVAELIELAKIYNWQIYNLTTNQMIHFNKNQTANLIPISKNFKNIKLL